jgi:molybdopterin-guanine dinucleotide biosynthesis protein A
MGRDKALVPVDGTAMAARVVAALRAGGCHPVVAVGGDRAALEALGIDVIDDPWPGEGPLGGVLAALGWAAGPVVVLACDVPFIDAHTVARLVAAPGDGDDGGNDDGPDAVVAHTDRPQPLCARWHQRATPVVAAAFAAGERSVRRALAGLSTASIEVDPAVIVDVDTPEDLAAHLPGSGDDQVEGR